MRLACLGLVLAVAGTAAGATDPAVRCATRRERAAARLASNVIGCVVAVVRGAPPNPACAMRAHDRAALAYATAAAAGGCGLAGSSIDGAIAGADRLATDVGAAIGASPGGPCEAAKLAAAGRKAVAKLRCHARPASPPSCLAHAEERFVRAFARAQAGGGCAASGDADAVEAAVDAYVDAIVTGQGCGNGVIEPGEACDGQPFCLPDCSQVVLPIPNGCCAVGGFCFEFSIVGSGGMECQAIGGVASAGSCVPDPNGTSGQPPLVAGQCQPIEFTPTRYCCDTPTPTCSDALLSDGNEIFGFLVGCLDLGSAGPIVAGACGPDGHCVPGS